MAGSWAAGSGLAVGALAVVGLGGVCGLPCASLGVWAGFAGECLVGRVRGGESGSGRFFRRAAPEERWYLCLDLLVC